MHPTATRSCHSGPYSGGRGAAAHTLPRAPARHPFHFPGTYLVTTLTSDNKPVSRADIRAASSKPSAEGTEQKFLVCTVP